MAITAQQVKELREKTGAGMMDCKKALVECDGDIEKSIEHLRKAGLAKAGKKAGRIAAEGAVLSVISDDRRKGALLELNCETDFVAKTDEFKALNQSICEVIIENKPQDLDSLLSSGMGGKTVQEIVDEKVAKIGEKITPRRFVEYSVDNGIVHSYIHANGTIGVLVEIAVDDAAAVEKDTFKEFYADLAMHIAASAPQYLVKEEVPQNEVNKELEIYKELLRKEGKQEEMLDNIARGKLSKYYKEVCLLEQPFVKEAKLSIQNVVQNVAKEVGTNVEIKRFTRLVLGEGIEKRQEDFAEEVRKASAV